MPKLILNEELPPDLREALEHDAKSEDITVNDAANRILTKNYGIEWKPSGFPYRSVSSRFKLRVAPALHREIRIEAADKLVTIRGVVLSILADHYGAEAISQERRPRREAV